MLITLKRPATCADCGAALPVGAAARWYRDGRVYGLTCHADTRPARERRSRRRGGRTAYERGDRSPGARASRYDRDGLYTADGECIGRVSCGHIDYPCCGCGQ